MNKSGIDLEVKVIFQSSLGDSDVWPSLGTTADDGACHICTFYQLRSITETAPVYTNPGDEAF